MREIFVRALDRQVSALGFGCASLGSRVSPAQGLQALQDAFEKGITWFDVAPPYGDGKAEDLLGQFLDGKRDQVVVCTKVGIRPPRLSLAARLGKPVVRAALNLAPGLRAQIAHHRPPSSRAPINATMIEASVTDSLRRLKVDHVDVLALHDPMLEEVLDEGVRAALAKMVEKGYARMIGVAGDRSVGERGAAVGYGMLQHAASSISTAEPSITAFRVTHSVYGLDGALRQLCLALEHDAALREEFLELEYVGSNTEIAATALMDYALSNNADGVVLTSMFRPEHLRFNISRASRPTDQRVVALLRKHALAAS